MKTHINPEFDLVIERMIGASKELVWKSWTQAEHLKQWFVPKPWTISECTIDLNLGGQFRADMRSPEGEVHPNEGCFLEIKEFEKLVWTTALSAGYRPVVRATNCPDLLFTATVLLETCGHETKLTAIVQHADAVTKASHEEMGFYDGWGTCFGQLADYVIQGSVG